MINEFIGLSQDDQETFRIFDHAQYIVALSGIYDDENVRRATIAIESEALRYTVGSGDYKALMLIAQAIRAAMGG